MKTHETRELIKALPKGEEFENVNLKYTNFPQLNRSLYHLVEQGELERLSSERVIGVTIVRYRPTEKLYRNAESPEMARRLSNVEFHDKGRDLPGWRTVYPELFKAPKFDHKLEIKGKFTRKLEA